MDQSMFLVGGTSTSIELNKQMIQFISLGQYRAVKCLLEEGKVDPNFSENHQTHPLIVAAKRNSVDIMAILIKHGADVNQCLTASGKSMLLMYADYFKNTKMKDLVTNNNNNNAKAAGNL